MKNKLSLKTFVWQCFNYISGISFLINFSVLFYGAKDGGIKIGYNFFWILTINLVLVFCVARAFCYLNKNHHQINGGPFVYVRTAIGRFCGFFILAVEYLLFPVVISYLIIGLIRTNFLNGEFSAIKLFHSSAKAVLFLDSIGVLIFICLVLLITIGIYWYKHFVKNLLYLNWIILTFVTILLVIIISENGSLGFQAISKNTTLNYGNFTKTLTTTFGFFVGFGLFTTVAQNLSDSERNMSKAILLAIFLGFLFHVVFTILVFGIAFKGGFQKNPLLQIINTVSSNKAFKTISSILLILSIMLPKVFRISQYNLFTAHGSLYPAAKENYIPRGFGQISKKGVCKKALLFNICFGTIWSLLFLIIPDSISVVINAPNPIFSFTDLLTIMAVIVIMVYMVVLAVALRVRLKYHKKIITHWGGNKIKQKIFQTHPSRVLAEWGWIYSWFIAFACLMFIVINYFVHLIRGFEAMDLTSVTGKAQLTFRVILLSYFGGVLLFINTWYWTYYRKRYLWRLKHNISLQKLMDIKFKVLKFEHVTSRYLDLFDIPTTTPNRMYLIWAKMIEYDMHINPEFQEKFFNKKENKLAIYSRLIDIPLVNRYRIRIIEATLLELSILRSNFE